MLTAVRIAWCVCVEWVEKISFWLVFFYDLLEKVKSAIKAKIAVCSNTLDLVSTICKWWRVLEHTKIFKYQIYLIRMRQQKKNKSEKFGYP